MFRPLLPPLLLLLRILAGCLCIDRCNGKVHVTLTTTLLPATPPRPTDGSAQGRVGGYHGGFVNQHLKLLTLLTVGIHLKVDAIIVPFAASRTVRDTGRVDWLPQQPMTLWDLSSIIALLRKHQIVFIKDHKPAAPADAVLLPNYYFQALDIDVIGGDVARLCEAQAAQGAVNVTLLAPDLLLALRTRDLPLYTEVVAAVRLAPELSGIAARIVERLHQSSPTFNGMHLRVSASAGSARTAASLAKYYNELTAIGEQASKVPLYIASGVFIGPRSAPPLLFTMLESWLRNWVVARGHASRVVNRHIMMLSEPAEHAALHSEQCAAVDWLVLLAAHRVIGGRASTFSFILQEARALQQVPRASLVIVDKPWWLLPLTAAVDVKA